MLKWRRGWWRRPRRTALRSPSARAADSATWTASCARGRPSSPQQHPHRMQHPHKARDRQCPRPTRASERADPPPRWCSARLPQAWPSAAKGRSGAHNPSLHIRSAHFERTLTPGPCQARACAAPDPRRRGRLSARLLVQPDRRRRGGQCGAAAPSCRQLHHCYPAASTDCDIATEKCGNVQPAADAGGEPIRRARIPGRRRPPHPAPRRRWRTGAAVVPGTRSQHDRCWGGGGAVRGGEKRRRSAAGRLLNSWHVPAAALLTQLERICSQTRTHPRAHYRKARAPQRSSDAAASQKESRKAS